jgi:uncharacterized protein (DUF58 family)
VFILFAGTAAALLIALPVALARQPRVLLECPIPARTTAGAVVSAKARLRSLKSVLPDLFLSLGETRANREGLVISPRNAFLGVGEAEPVDIGFTVEARARGRYRVSGPTARTTDPLRLVAGRALALPDQTVTVYPRFWRMAAFDIPLGRRFHPGGIPLSSNIGESIEFVGTRDFRQGDPVRSIHFRSWARRGAPVVKEYQEEYFCRIAIVLDTFLPERATQKDRERFEAAISLTASVADFFSRSENVVDVLAAGPDLYEVSAGRSLAYLENILDVLACLDPCRAAPFQTITPTLFDRLGQVTSVVAILLDWDKQRETFLRRITTLGTAVRAIVVRETTIDGSWQEFGDGRNMVELMSPSDVEQALATSGQ